MTSLFAPPNALNGTPWKGLKVGLLGGSFNPAHEGHRHISLHALNRLGLDAVWWMVSPQNPLKSTHDMAPLDERLQSSRDVSNHPRIVATDIETQMATRYTVDTLAQLRKVFPDTKFVWLMGTDNLHQVHKWRLWQEIFTHTPVCVLNRPPHGSSLKNSAVMMGFGDNFIPQEQALHLAAMQPPAWTLLHIPLNETSSTAIRARRKK